MMQQYIVSFKMRHFAWVPCILWTEFILLDFGGLLLVSIITLVMALEPSKGNALLPYG